MEYTEKTILVTVEEKKDTVTEGFVILHEMGSVASYGFVTDNLNDAFLLSQVLSNLDKIAHQEEGDLVKIKIINFFEWTPQAFNESLENLILILEMVFNYEVDLISDKSFSFQYRIENKRYAPVKEKKKQKKGFVYLMLDTANSFYKIGFTKNKPKYRETTLQSQKPTIKLINKWEGTMRQEKELHSLFFRKRIRGEWFDLKKEDVDFISEYFSL